MNKALKEAEFKKNKALLAYNESRLMVRKLEYLLCQARMDLDKNYELAVEASLAYLKLKIGEVK